MMPWRSVRSTTAITIPDGTVRQTHAQHPAAKPPRLIQMALTFCVLVLTALSAQPAAAQLNRDGVNAALRASVQIVVPDPAFEDFKTGSGTILTADGLILTNNHVVDGDRPNGLFNDQGLVAIGVVPPDLRGEAVLKYIAKVVKSGPELDLALLQIVGLLDDPDAPLPANLGLSPIELGNSDDLVIGDNVHVFGFPGLGGNSPTYTRGTISGFEDENRDGIYDWIKTDANISSGNSGGLAVDDNARFIGVPTWVRFSEMATIGRLRIGNIALGFVNSYFPEQPGSGPRITDVQYSPSINRRGQPVNAATAFPNGTTDLYAVFSYTGFSDGRPLTYIWYRDGLEITRDSFAWDGGDSGSSWVSIYNEQGLANGFTELQLVFDGTALYRGGVMVGPGTTPSRNQNTNASFGAITFAEGIEGNQPVGPATTFSGVNEVFAFFSYQGMSNGLNWMTRWYYNGQPVLERPGLWESGATGNYFVSLSHPDGLPTGQFKLELYIQDRLVQEGTFSVQDAGRRGPRDVGLIGTVVDANNRRNAVSGALIVFLKPGNTVGQWVAQDFPDSMVHGTATSNRRGEFQLSARVVPGEFYSIVVVHDDYYPITVDNFQIPADAQDPHELTASMDPN